MEYIDLQEKGEIDAAQTKHVHHRKAIYEAPKGIE